jgi:hypothetical protein
MTKSRAKSLTVLGLICLIGASWCEQTAGQGKNAKYISERNPHAFLGATRVAVEEFDSTDKGPSSALLQLDKNEVTFSPFGDSRITAVFYKPFPVKLTRLNIVDTTNKDRRLFAVELPKDAAEGLGKNSLRLATVTGKNSELLSLRLLLVDTDNKVTQVVELRPTTN